MNKSTPVMELKGVGDKTAKLFAKLNILSVGDLLAFYPRDYEEFEDPVKIRQAVPGETCAVYAAVAGIPSEKRVRKLTILNVNISDDTGRMELTFFNMPYLKKTLQSAGYYVFRGIVQSRGFVKIMEQPKIFGLEEYNRQTYQLSPKYSLTKGLTNNAVQKCVKQALSLCPVESEYYPDWILQDNQLMDVETAFHTIHFPKDYESLIEARRRLVFDEFFSFMYLIQRNREYSSKLVSAYQFFETADTVRFLEQLPFGLTGAQKRVWQEIKDDLGSAYCMNRLVQGDVGSGKTILAVLALLMTAANGYQGALMAPTEVLAMQHYETLQEYVNQYGLMFKPVLLMGSMGTKEKRIACEKIANGEANVIIGTHALIQERVAYKNLALVVTDEQHRFGVRQREHLAAKGKNPHILVMSATPIPRTLAIILYGDLQVSVVNELPSNRLPIKNCVVNTAYRPKAYEFIAKQVALGRQAYVICPQVEEGELEDLENVVDYTEKLKNALPSSVQVDYLHGKMRSADKNRIMEEFARKSIDVLVSTTVIEVGINVPNATVMMVENAERFGLAQLHQLRGRVGRGEHQSYCIFVSTNEKPETMERLKILNGTNDGFQIASEDLKLRGPGDFFGVRQSGDFAFRMGDIYADASVLSAAQATIEKLMRLDAGLELPDHKALREHLNDVSLNGVDFRTI